MEIERLGSRATSGIERADGGEQSAAQPVAASNSNGVAQPVAASGKRNKSWRRKTQAGIGKRRSERNLEKVIKWTKRHGNQNVAAMPDVAMCMKGPCIDRILSGQQTWQVSWRRTRFRGVVGLAESGTGNIIGQVRIVDCLQVARSDFPQRFHKHGVFEEPWKQKQRDGLPGVSWKSPSGAHDVFAWVLEEPERYLEPSSYVHLPHRRVWGRGNTSGWVRLSPTKTTMLSDGAA